MMFSSESRALIDLFKEKDYEIALYMAKKKLVHDQHDDRIIRSLIAARICLKKDAFEEANTHLESCRKMFAEGVTQPVHLAVYYLWKGVIELVDSRYASTIEYCLKSEKEFSKCITLTWWEEENLTYLYYTFGAVYYTVKFFEDSKFYCDLAEKLAEKHDNKSVLGSIMNIRGKMAQKTNQLEAARHHFEVYARYADTPSKQCMYLHNMAELSAAMKNYEEEIKYLKEAATIELNPETRMGKILLGRTYNMLGEVHAKSEELEKSELFQLKAFRYVGDVDQQDERVDELSGIKKKICESLCKLYTHQKQHEKAYNFSQKVIQLQTKELNYATDARIAALRIQYEKQDTSDIVENFNQKVEELQSLNNYLSQIASSISHDVRAPLRNTISYLGILEYKQRNAFNQEAREYLETALQAAKDAEMLTKSLSDLGKINVEQSSVSEVSIEEIVQRVRRNLEEEIQHKNVQFEVASLPTITANEGQMLQLFQNLISNAIKYNEQEQPLIKITHEKNTDYEHIFSIADNGIGISPENHQKIFQIFKRLHRDSEYEGTGIGLAICALIVKKYDGEIWVESDGENGSNFKFTLHTY